MAIHTISNVPLVPQDKTNGCWYFCLRMLAQWSASNGGAIVDPSTISTLENLYQGNCGYAPSTAKDLTTKLSLSTVPRLDRGQAEYQTLLVKGPLWCQGLKGGANGFPHVVVIAGVADTGLLILDPLPLLTGERSWKTWAWVKDYLQTTDPSMDYNILSP